MVDQIRFFAGAARMLEGRSAGEYMAGHTSFVRREPIGVCAQVTPWNYPMMMAVWKWAPAIAAGNTVVLKPSDTTPVSTLLMAEIMAEFLPRRRLQRGLRRPRHRPGARRAPDPADGLDHRLGAGRHGGRRAAPRADLKKVHLELGGKAPVVVFDDADLEAAAEAIAVAGYFNAGQDCTAATRVLAAPGIHDDFVAALAEQAKDSAKTGLPDDEDVLFGPLNNANQLDRVMGMLCPRARSTRRWPRAAAGSVATWRAASSTRRPSCPGCARTTRWSRTRCSARSSRCSGSPTRTRRSAGPTACEYGLASSVWTKDHGRAMRMAKRLDFGCVWINTHIPLVAEMPHGGFKHSGYGKDLSMYGFEDYTRVKHVMSNIEA